MKTLLSCARARAFIEDALDDGLDERRRLELDGHIRLCPACRRFCDSASTVRDLLAEARSVEPTAAAVQRMRRRFEESLASQGTSPTPRLAARPILRASAAAALLLALGTAGLLLVTARGAEVDRGALSSARGELSPLQPAVEASPATSVTPRVRVTQLTGESQVRGEGAPRGLALDSLVKQGASISTAAGGLLVAVVCDDLRLAAGGGTELLLERLEAGERRLRLAAGRLVCDVTPATESGSRLEVVAGDVTVRVVGTVFAVEVDEARGVEVRVERGQVAVIAGAHGEVIVGAGQRGLFPPGTASGEVRELGERIAAADRALLRGEPPPRSAPAEAADAGTLFRRADEARRRGDVAAALGLYRRIVALDPSGPSGGTALISLGQLSLGRSPAEARRSFQAYLSHHRRGPMRQEAFEGLMRAEVALGHGEVSRDVARRYLHEHGSGRYAARARQLLEATP